VKAGAIGSIPTVAVGSIANVVVLFGGAVVLVVEELVVEELVVLVVLVVEVGVGAPCSSKAPISTVPLNKRTNGVPR
jgi:hypothetical protein